MKSRFLLTTVLTAAVCSMGVAQAAEASKKHKAVKHDDAYSPAKHTAHAAPKVEEVVVFADVKQEVRKVESKPQNALINHDGLAIQVKGNVNFQYGHVNQDEFFENPAVNGDLPNVDRLTGYVMPTFGVNKDEGKKFLNRNAFVTKGGVDITAAKEDKHGNKYGLEIDIDTDSSKYPNDKGGIASKLFIFTENKMGRVEVGAMDGVSENMAISATSITKATGGIDGDYSSWVSYGVVAGKDNEILTGTFLTYPSLPYAYNHCKKANKLNYYAPSMNGFRVGFGYTPDVTVKGAIEDAVSFKSTGYKNVFEGGVVYDAQFNNMGLGFSATGQIGSARDAYIQDTKKPVALHNLGAWQVGGKVSYDGLTAAASYGDWGKSGTVKEVKEGTPAKKANFWTAGVAYDYSDLGGVSLTYMSSNTKGAFSTDSLSYIKAHQDAFDAATNKFESISFGAEYKLMPGLVPYAEVSGFRFKTDLADTKANEGTVILGGVKLQF